MLFQERIFVRNTSTIHGRFIEFTGTLHKEAFSPLTSMNLFRDHVDKYREQESSSLRCIPDVPIKRSRHDSGTALFDVVPRFTDSVISMHSTSITIKCDT
jgi:hypothetical protein